MIPTPVSRYLDQHHANYSPLPHATAFTAQEEAAAAHVPGSKWAKPVVFFADDEPILAVVAASSAVHVGRLLRVVDARSVRLAQEAELAGLYPDCEPGAVPPFGPLHNQRVFVDAALTTDPAIVFNAGSHHDAIRMPYREFERLARPVVAHFATEAAPSSLPRSAILTDPVCGMALEDRHTDARSEHRGATYYFCSQSCKMEFDDNPFAYA